MFAFCGFAAYVFVFAAQTTGEDPPLMPPTATRIAEAIARLSSDDFAVREQSTEELFRIGEEARAELVKAAQSPNVEIAARASLVIARLNAIPKPAPVRVVRPPPPPVDLVAEFRKAETTKRFGIIFQLQQPKDFEAVIKLINEERVEADKRNLDGNLVRRLLILAGDHNSGNRIVEAERLLSLKVENTRVQSALNLIVVTRNRAAAQVAELERQLAAKPDPAVDRRLALVHYAAGDFVKAESAAKESGAHDLACWSGIAAGNWTGALASHRRSWDEKPPTAKQTALWLVLARHAGDEGELAAATKAMLRHVHEAPETLQIAAPALVVAEQYDDAVRILKRASPSGAFELLCERQAYGEAFRLASVSSNDEIDALWYEILRATGPVSGSYSLDRPSYVERVIGALADVGRQEDASRAMQALEGSVRRRRESIYGWTTILSAQLRLGRRDDALATAAAAIEAERAMRPPPPPPGRPQQGPVAAAVSAFGVLRRLYPQASALLQTAWAPLIERHANDPTAAIAKLEKLYYPPAAAQLTRDARRSLFDELMEAAPGKESYRCQIYLQQLAKLAEAHGDDELRWRYSEQALAVVRATDGVRALHRATDAYERRDWASVSKWLERAELSRTGGNSYEIQRGTALVMLGDSEEGHRRIDKALAWTLDPNEYAKLADTFATEDKHSEADKLFRIAFQASLPGEAASFHAAQRWADATAVTSPSHSAHMLRIGQLDAPSGLTNRALSVFLEQNRRIHVAAARGYLAAGDPDAAVAEAKRAYEALPGNIDVAIALVPLLEKAGRRDLADEVYRLAAEHVQRLCREFPSSTHFRERAEKLAAECGR